MKKLLSLLLVFSCVLTLSACGSGEKESEKELAVYELEEKIDETDYIETKITQFIFDDTNDSMGEVKIKDILKYEITNESFDKSTLSVSKNDVELEAMKSSYQAIKATADFDIDEENLSSTTTITVDFSDTIAVAFYELPVTEKTKDFVDSLKAAGYKKK